MIILLMCHASGRVVAGHSHKTQSGLYPCRNFLRKAFVTLFVPLFCKRLVRPEQPLRLAVVGLPGFSFSGVHVFYGPCKNSLASNPTQGVESRHNWSYLVFHPAEALVTLSSALGFRRQAPVNAGACCF